MKKNNNNKMKMNTNNKNWKKNIKMVVQRSLTIILSSFTSSTSVGDENFINSANRGIFGMFLFSTLNILFKSEVYILSFLLYL